MTLEFITSANVMTVIGGLSGERTIECSYNYTYTRR